MYFIAKITDDFVLEKDEDGEEALIFETLEKAKEYARDLAYNCYILEIVG